MAVRAPRGVVPLEFAAYLNYRVRENTITKAHYLLLPQSEAVVATMAATIYAAYIQAGAVGNVTDDEYIALAGDAAIKLAEYVDKNVKSDEEFVKKSSDGDLML